MALLLAGCAVFPPQHLGAEDIARIRSEAPIRVVVDQPPPFRQSTHFDAMGTMFFGPLGYEASMRRMQTAGAHTSRNIELTDPSIRIRDRFIAGVTSEFGWPPPVLLDSDASADGESLRPDWGAGLVLELKTLAWEMTTDTANLLLQDRFGVYVLARARLIRPDQKRVLWQNTCGVLPRDKASVEALQKDKGNLLKRWLADAADLCAKELLAKVSDRNRSR